VVKSRKDVVGAWHFLGLAYERQGSSKDARKAHEQAVKAGEMMLDALFTALATRKDTGDSEHFRPSLALAAQSAERYQQLGSNLSKSKLQEWKSRSEALRDYAGMSMNNAPVTALSKIYMPTEVTTRARVLQRRDEPEYTEEARRNLVSGIVVLRAVIAFDGRLRGIRVVSGLPFGLTQNAIDAARKIKFAPALLNGQPVSQYIQIEYNFNLM
jgi:TonB family protein